MRRTVPTLTAAALVALALFSPGPARADWTLGNAVYPADPTPDSGSTFTKSSTRPDISGNSQAYCSGGPGSSSLDWSPAPIQQFVWQGAGTPSSSFWSNVNAYVTGSATANAIVCTASSSAAFNQTGITGAINGPYDGTSYAKQFPTGTLTDAYQFITAGSSPIGSTSSLSVHTTASGTSGCRDTPSASGSAYAKAYITFSTPYH